MKKRKEARLSGVITSENYDLDHIYKYWKNNKHVYICCSKVGSSTIRQNCHQVLDIPYMHKRKIISERYRESFFGRKTIYDKYREFFSRRKAFFICRNPFYRLVSSYEYRNNPRFDKIKKEYLEQRNIDISSLNIVEYTKLLNKEYKDKKRNMLMSHFQSQKSILEESKKTDMKISLLWDTEKIDDLLEIWAKVLDTKVSLTRVNVSINEESKYFQPYLDYPELFLLVKDVFKEDLEWLNPLFNFEEKFKERLKSFGLKAR